MEFDDHHETLVVAARTAEHPQLVAALKRRAGEQPTTYTLLVPALPAEDGEPEVDLAAGWLAALESAERAALRLREAGLDLREAIVGDADCAAALGDATHARRFDEVLLATSLPAAGEPKLELQRIANKSLSFRSSSVGGFLRGRRSGGVILDSRNTAPRWQYDAGKRTRARSARARAAGARRSSS